MQDSAIMHMSIPNINQLLLNFGSNALNFEHTYFLTLENLDYIAAKTGFEILSVDNYINHSFFVYQSLVVDSHNLLTQRRR